MTEPQSQQPLTDEEILQALEEEYKRIISNTRRTEENTRRLKEIEEALDKRIAELDLRQAALDRVQDCKTKITEVIKAMPQEKRESDGRALYNRYVEFQNYELGDTKGEPKVCPISYSSDAQTNETSQNLGAVSMHPAVKLASSETGAPLSAALQRQLAAFVKVA